DLQKSRGAVMGGKVNSDRFVGILWSHPVFNLQKSCGAVLGDKVNGDRFLAKVGKILVVLEIQLP
ncbi:hypothetical protein, partial [Cylindrospermopsis raciborskii]|uniref:hypothetical protein n=1 Tax=Cylindrospermopsis raciborskii TaxID=77022 RepID=UPI001454DE02